MRNPFKKLTENCENIQKIRSYEFKYHETIERCCSLLDEALKSTNRRKWHPDADDYLRSETHGQADINGIKRFFSNGRLYAFDEDKPYPFEEYSRYLPSIEKLDEIAKLTMEFDEVSSKRVKNTITRFKKSKISLRHIELKDHEDRYTIDFELPETDRVRLENDLRLKLSIKNNKVRIQLVNFTYFDGPEDRGPYNSGWRKWLAKISTFELASNKDLSSTDNDDLKVIRMMLEDFNCHLGDALTYIDGWNRIKGYSHMCMLPKKSIKFTIHYSEVHPDHYEVEDYLRDDDL